jgi:hypothetical protein
MRQHNPSCLCLKRLPGIFLAIVSLLSLAACFLRSSTPTPTPTPTRDQVLPVVTPTATLPSGQEELFQTYAQGELLPDMRVPIQRSESGEGGWYAVIGTEEGWAQFLSQMGQPAEIWEPVSWTHEILIGAMLGVRRGRGHAITISDLKVEGITVQIEVSITAPQSEPVDATWITYPFHFVRLARAELPLGSVTFEFVAAEQSSSGLAGQVLVSQSVDMTDLNILWLPGETAIYPTPTALPSTSTPAPERTPTPVPNLQSIGTVLAVTPDAFTVRLLPDQGNPTDVELMQATSILFENGQAATVAQILPGMTISVLGYEGEGGTMRAAHIDIVREPPQTTDFAAYRSREAGLSTLYDGYALPLSATSISSTVPLSQTFNLTQTRVLTQNGFIVVPDSYPNFEALYDDPEHADNPVFISTDSVLHTSQLLLSQVCHSVEQSYLLPELRMLEHEMFDLSWAQYETMQASTTPAEQRVAATALRNAAYFAVPLSLLDPDFGPPDVISPVVETELSLIAASEIITISPLLDLPGVPDDEKLRVDYSRFVPPANYGYDDGLANYFRALAWHRAIALRPSQREETRSAVLIAYTINTHSAARVLWERIQSVLGFFHGQDASFTPDQYGDLLALVWDENVEPIALADEEGLDALTRAIDTLPLPSNPIWTFWTKDGYAERDWYFFSLPFWVDTYVFQQTTGGHVGGAENPRYLPSYVDLAAVLGSLEAYRVATELGETEYANYLDQIGKVRNELSALQLGHWTADLHGNWLRADSSAIQDKTPSYPEWMRTASWQRKELQTVFGSWVGLQSNVDTAFPSNPDHVPASENMPVASWGYVEPQPETYARVAALTRQVIDGLDSRLMLTQVDHSSLLDLEAWLIFLQDIARRELTGQALTAEEHRRLGGYGAMLQALASEEGSEVATAARIATAETGQLIEATGPIHEIYVVVERGRERFLARGGVYSHYEFTWPVGEAMPATRWREMLDAGEMPERPLWVEGFTIE